jgi:hypothetical protein
MMLTGCWVGAGNNYNAGGMQSHARIYDFFKIAKTILKK